MTWLNTAGLSSSALHGNADTARNLTQTFCFLLPRAHFYKKKLKLFSSQDTLWPPTNEIKGDSMKRGILIGLTMAVFSTSGAWAEGDQQTRMKTCNADAKQQNLSGDVRKAFMKTCLSGKDNAATAATPATPATKAESAKPAAPGTPSATDMDRKDKPLTTQQQRMKDCNAEAKTKELKGDPRKAFMKSCLSNKK